MADEQRRKVQAEIEAFEIGERRVTIALREAEAVHLQSQISDALLREQDFFGLAITPTVHAGMRKNAPARIEVTGQAPSTAVRDAALRVVRDEASRMGRDFEIEDHIEVTPAAARRIA